MVLVDNAGWHVAKRLAVPANVVRHFLPPGTPERPPAEPLGPLVRAAVANRSIGRIDRLRAILRGRLAYLARNPAMVQPVVGFRWAARLEWLELADKTPAGGKLPTRSVSEAWTSLAHASG